MADDIKKQVADWITRIDLAEKLRKLWEEEWDRNYKAIYGNDWLKGDTKVGGRRQEGQDHITGGYGDHGYKYEKILAYLKTELPSLVLFQPEVYLSASDWAEHTHPEAQKQAKVV